MCTMNNNTIVTDDVYSLSENVGKLLSQRRWRLITAESCTGGGIAAMITAVAGSSAWCEGGFITYSNAMKINQLGVDASLIETYGAVSKPVVIAMTKGALEKSNAQVAIAVSGIAGPGGASKDKPLGTVWLAWALPENKIWTHRFCFKGDREQIRLKSVRFALTGLYFLCKNENLCFNNN